jgi:hypothetical protein
MIKRYANVIGEVAGGGTPCYFSSFTNQTSGASFYQEDATITGAAGALVTLQVTGYDTDNSTPAFYINTQIRVLNGIVYVTLDGTGHVTIPLRVEGNAAETGTHLFGIVTIVGVSSGSPSGLVSRTVSKIF